MNKLKKLLTGASLLLLASQASAYWHVEASSPSGYGWGEASSYSKAVNIALYNCAQYTPSWEMCIVTNYYWVN